MSDERAPAYWAVLPATVRHDAKLRPNAKLLYAEITALANSVGYCFASNGYLGQQLGIDSRTVSDLVSGLAKKGYVRVEVVRDPKTNAVLERRIWVDASPLHDDAHPPIAKNGYTPPAKNSATPHEENSDTPPAKNKGTPHAKNGVENNINNFNNTPIAPKGADAQKDAEMRMMLFTRFWNAYPRKVDKQRALRAWKKINPDLDTCRKMARTLEQFKRCPSWTKDNGAYIPYPATWLNGQRWEDEDILPPATGDDPGLAGSWAKDPEVI